MSELLHNKFGMLHTGGGLRFDNVQTRHHSLIDRHLHRNASFRIAVNCFRLIQLPVAIVYGNGYRLLFCKVSEVNIDF